MSQLPQWLRNFDNTPDSASIKYVSPKSVSHWTFKFRPTSYFYQLGYSQPARSDHQPMTFYLVASYSDQPVQTIIASVGLYSASIGPIVGLQSQRVATCLSLLPSLLALCHILTLKTLSNPLTFELAYCPKISMGWEESLGQVVKSPKLLSSTEIQQGSSTASASELHKASEPLCPLAGPQARPWHLLGPE